MAPDSNTAKGVPSGPFLSTIAGILEFGLMATKLGEIKKTSLHDFESVRRNGLRAMDLEPKDELCWVRHCSAGDDVILVSEQGQALRFGVDSLRTASRTSVGVRGLKLAAGDLLAGMDVVEPDGGWRSEVSTGIKY